MFPEFGRFQAFSGLNMTILALERSVNLDFYLGWASQTISILPSFITSSHFSLRKGRSRGNRHTTFSLFAM